MGRFLVVPGKPAGCLCGSNDDSCTGVKERFHAGTWRRVADLLPRLLLCAQICWCVSKFVHVCPNLLVCAHNGDDAAKAGHDDGPLGSRLVVLFPADHHVGVTLKKTESGFHFALYLFLHVISSLSAIPCCDAHVMMACPTGGHFLIHTIKRMKTHIVSSSHI
jgi:hypothetical protein